VLSAPFVPDAAAKMLEGLQTDDTSWPDDVEAALSVLPAGHAFTVPEVLFAKIQDEERDAWQEKFSGTRD
jgi:methionyl-tRNA synthetase